jgi:hypothetical protein
MRPDELHAEQVECGRKRVATALGREQSALARSMVPEDIALAALANYTDSLIGPDFALHGMTLINSLPWLARVPVEQLFLPRDWLGALVPESSVEKIEKFRPYQEHRTAGRPATHVRDTPKLGRNDRACAAAAGSPSTAAAAQQQPAARVVPRRPRPLPAPCRLQRYEQISSAQPASSELNGPQRGQNRGSSNYGPINALNRAAASPETSTVTTA